MSTNATVAISRPLNTENLMEREDLLSLIKSHALGGAAAGLGIAWLPGAGSVICSAVAITALWSMYFRINKCIGLKTSKVFLRTIASAMLSNIAQSAILFVGGTALAGLLSLTGIGGVASSVIMASLDYAVIYIGGLMYLKLLTKLMKAGQDPSHMRPEEMEISIRETLKDEDINALIRQYAGDYKRGRKNGTITGEETYEQVDEEDE